MRASIAAFGLVGLGFLVGCGGSGDNPTGESRDRTWTEEELRFTVDGDELHGLLTLPVTEGPHPAVVIASGSEDPEGGIQSGVSHWYFVDLAHRFAEEGYAAYRYDTRGIGRSEGRALPGLETKRDEVIGAVDAVRQHPSIGADDVGVWGMSQEAWTIAMAAAMVPDEVAFVIPVSGAGLSVADQQIWGIESQSRAAGLADSEVDRAVLIGRLLVDWQLDEPVYEESNRELAGELGEGPWTDLLATVYDLDVGPADGLSRSIEILSGIVAEPWAAALHLEEVYLPALRSIPPDQVEVTRVAAARSLLTDPRDHLSRVTSPVIAVFGEDDIVQPSELSAELYAEYLREAGNDDVTITVLPGVGHHINPTTPGYWDHLLEWLAQRT